MRGQSSSWRRKPDRSATRERHGEGEGRCQEARNGRAPPTVFSPISPPFTDPSRLEVLRTLSPSSSSPPPFAFPRLAFARLNSPDLEPMSTAVATASPSMVARKAPLGARIAHSVAQKDARAVSGGKREEARQVGRKRAARAPGRAREECAADERRGDGRCVGRDGETRRGAGGRRRVLPGGVWRRSRGAPNARDATSALSASRASTGSQLVARREGARDVPARFSPSPSLGGPLSLS